MDALVRELRYACRMLVAKPGFTLVTVITLALGIGANTAIFNVINAVLLRPLPYPDGERLVRIFGTVEARGVTESSASLPDYFDWIRQSSSFEHIAGFVRWSYSVVGEDHPERLWGGMITANLLQAMATEPVLGRGFLPEEDRPGGERVVLLSYGLWQKLFAGAPDVLGKKLRVEDLEHRIVGVMPQGFAFPEDAQLWTPLALGPDSYPRSLHFLRTVARLAPGVSLEVAETELGAIVKRLEEQYPDSNTGRGVTLVPLQQHMVGDFQPALLVLLGATGLVLLIACGNVTNLLLSRATEREGEIKVCQALGATKVRLLGRFLIDSLLLALLGGALALVLAVVGVDMLVALTPYDIPGLDAVSIDGRVFAFTFLIAVLAAVAVSVIPALQFSERNLSQYLKEGGRGTMPGSRSHKVRSILVVAEVALALTLVIGAGLLIRSFTSLLQVDPGCRTNNVMTLELVLPDSKYAAVDETAGFYSELLERIEALQGVHSASASWGLPVSKLRGDTGFTIEGRPTGGPGEKNVAALQPVSADYFRTLGIPLLSGRTFTAHDDADALPVLIINEAMARRFWPDEDPLGKRVSFEVNFGPVGNLARASREIVGIVGNVKSSDLAAAAEPEMYFPYRQSTWRMMSVAVHASTDPLILGPALRQAVWAIDKHQPISQLRTMEQIFSEAMARTKFNTVLLSLFAAIALILAMVGVFGVISYSVSQRTHEIGLRMALGAQHRHVVRQVVGEGMVLTVVGLLAGLAGALALTRVLSALLFEVTATDPTTFGGVSLVVMVVALLACYLPARRAARVDPLMALRYE